MEIKRDGGNLQKDNAPRYIVSIGSYVNEGAALSRRDMATKAGYRSEVIDLRDDNTTTSVAALLLIAEQVQRLTNKVEEIAQAVKNIPKAEQPKEEKAEPPKQNKIELKDVFRQKRNEAGFTQRAVAKKAGIPSSTYEHYENGRTTKVNPGTLLKICAALNISNDEIIKYL